MSIVLDRVELANIRSHSSVAFEPAKQGLTAISGPNGVGKSTLVDAIGWCLYGSKPQGVSKVASIVRDGTVLGTDRAFAQVELTIDSRHFKIIRRFVTKNAGVECEVFETEDRDLPESDPEKWTNVAGPSVSHAEPYIRKLLRMDEKGFLAAILVQQKQVDQLISATPRERGAVIEKLTGIASITAAVTESRQEYNNLRKMATYSTVDEAGLQDLRDSLLAHEESLELHTQAHNDLTRDAKALKERGVQLRKEVDEATERADAATEAKTRLATLSGLIGGKEGELDRLVREKNEKKKRLSGIATGGSLSEVEGKMAGLRSSLKSVEEEAYGLKKTALDLEAKAKDFEALIERSSIKDLEEAKRKRDETLSKIEQGEARLSNLRETSGGLAGQKESLLRAVEVLEEGEGKCPTCLQEVNDTGEAVTTLRKEADAIEGRRAESLEQEEKISTGLVTLRAHVEKYGTLIDALDGLPSTVKAFEESQARVQELEGDRRSLEGEIKALDKIVQELRAHEDLKNEYSALLASAQAVSRAIEELKREEAALKEKNFDSPTPAALQKMRRALETAQADYVDLTSKLSEERSEVRVLREQVKHLQEKISEQEEQVKKHKDLLKSVEVASNTTQVLEEFRSNRIESSVPLIESYASDLLSRFTEGKFTRFKLDGKFNASVVLADGTERSIGLLSGGELSAASMALRLAVAMLLNGGSAQSLMILDEVLVSQDSTRAELILSTIKQVCRGQVVIIAHNDVVSDVSDKLVDLA